MRIIALVTFCMGEVDYLQGAVVGYEVTGPEELIVFDAGSV
jgi:hypothetical protein